MPTHEGDHPVDRFKVCMETE